jgi:hypothetical protein
MQRIAPLLYTGASAQEARNVLAANPDLVAYLTGLKSSHRSLYRAKLSKVYDQGVVDVLIPLRAKGGARQVKYTGPWELLSAPARTVVAAATGLESLERSVAADWDEKTVTTAADALVQYYLGPDKEGSASSVAMALRGLRAGLATLDVDPEISRASRREDITALHNQKIAKSREERVAAGIEVPAPYARIGDLINRVKAFIATPTSMSAQTAADFLVALSARPGELETLTLGPRGAVKGVLKKRGDPSASFNIVSSIGQDLASDFVAAWQKASPPLRHAAVLGLERLVTSWGLQRRDLRAIGAHLAVKAEVLAGRATNSGQERKIHADALRHKAAPRAQDHYERVNDPLAQLCVQLGELSVEQLDIVKGLVASLQA